MEVFNRLELGVRRAYTFTITTGMHPYFLGTFYVRRRAGELLGKDSALYRRLRRELYNTQILATDSPTYREFVQERLMTGEEASLVDAFIGFCHTNLAHSQPDSFTLEDVVRAFHSHPDIALKLTRLFGLRFDPDSRTARPYKALEEAAHAVEKYNTGHGCWTSSGGRSSGAPSFHPADPEDQLLRAGEAGAGVPARPCLPRRPGPGIHLGSPPGASVPGHLFLRPPRAGVPHRLLRYRAGRLAHHHRQDPGRYDTTANTLFREVYVLAHTQHLKNKDIYEGGSKMVVVALDPGEDPGAEIQRLYKVQYGFINAFLDIFVTAGGQARDPRVVDYYGEDEPIELGPDENMHDSMVEAIAALGGPRLHSRDRHHVEQGSRDQPQGVRGHLHRRGHVRRGRHAGSAGSTPERPVLRQVHRGPQRRRGGERHADPARRCPKAAIRLILDGTGALFDPAGADREELSRIVLQGDADAFRPGKLNPGGFLLYRTERRTEGLRELFRRVDRTEEGLRESWVTADEFNKEFEELIFTVPADLFIPAGGRPETVDG